MADILTPEALAFVEKLARQFEPARQKLLARRIERSDEMAGGNLAFNHSARVTAPQHQANVFDR